MAVPHSQIQFGNVPFGLGGAQTPQPLNAAMPAWAIQEPNSTMLTPVSSGEFNTITADGTTAYGVAFVAYTHLRLRSVHVPFTSASPVPFAVYRVDTRNNATTVVAMDSVPANTSTFEFDVPLYVAPFWSTDAQQDVPPADNNSDPTAQPVVYALGYFPPAGATFTSGGLSTLVRQPLVAVRGSMLASNVASLPTTITVPSSGGACQTLYYGMSAEVMMGTPGITVWSNLQLAWDVSREVVVSSSSVPAQPTLLVRFLERWNVAELVMQADNLGTTIRGGANTGFTDVGLMHLIEALSEARVMSRDGSGYAPEGCLLTLVIPVSTTLNNSLISDFSFNSDFKNQTPYSASTPPDPPSLTYDAANLAAYLIQEGPDPSSVYRSSPLLTIVQLALACRAYADAHGGSPPANVKYMAFDTSDAGFKANPNPADPKPYRTNAGFCTYLSSLVAAFRDPGFGDFSTGILYDMGLRFKCTSGRTQALMPAAPIPWANADYVQPNIPVADPTAAPLWPGGMFSEAYVYDSSGTWGSLSDAAGTVTVNNLVTHRPVSWVMGDEQVMPCRFRALDADLSDLPGLTALPVEVPPYLNDADFGAAYNAAPYEAHVMLSAQCSPDAGSTLQLPGGTYTTGWKAGVSCDNPTGPCDSTTGESPPDDRTAEPQVYCPWGCNWVLGRPSTALDVQNLLGNLWLYRRWLLEQLATSAYPNKTPIVIVPSVYALNALFILDTALESGQYAQGLPTTYMGSGTVQSCVRSQVVSNAVITCNLCVQNCPGATVPQSAEVPAACTP